MQKSRALFFLVSLFVILYLQHAQAEEKPVYHVYLAGPEVFLDNAIAAGENKKAQIEKLNKKYNWPFKLVGLYPLDNSIPDFKPDFDTGMRIYHANIQLMQQADFIAANMVRFRGPSMDVGTAFEMGFMAGSNKPVFAYYEAQPFYGNEEKPGLLTAKVQKHWHMHPEDTSKDKDGIHIENFNMIDNLMMVGAYTDTGYPVSANFEELILKVADHILSKNE